MFKNSLGIYWKNQLFQIRAVIQIMIDYVKKLIVSNLTTIRERDFKSDVLFGTFSFATNLVTSLNFRPIRCATKLCQF